MGQTALVIIQGRHDEETKRSAEFATNGGTAPLIK